MDVTEQRAAEHARRTAEHELAALNVDLERRVLERTLELEAANAELEAFSCSVSHDLWAPLRALDGFSLALFEDCGRQLDDIAKDYLARVRAASQRMGHRIDDMLALSRVSRRQTAREKVDLSALARELVVDLREAEPERAVEVEVAEGLSADGASALLRIVLQNLLANVWKFASRKPQARIEVGADRHGAVTATRSRRRRRLRCDIRRQAVYAVPAAPRRRVPRHWHRSRHREAPRPTPRRVGLGRGRCRLRSDLLNFTLDRQGGRDG